ncbi:MAG: hypothetical protein JWQ08_1536 [Deinococcus sp.]|nr:hypothetical protein [Deinococcus sp.]
MRDPVAAQRSIVVERYLPHPAEKIWRALTEGHLTAQWLMPGNFEAVVGHRFTLSSAPVPHWNGVTEGEVLEVQPYDRLVYRWQTAGAAPDGLRTTVTWTLSPQNQGVLLRMEHSGFRPQDEPNYQGLTFAWHRFLASLEGTVVSLGLQDIQHPI